jgi:carboxypeptidase Taq
MVKSFMEYVRNIKNYHEAAAVLAWDLRTGAPRKGVEKRSEVIGMLSGSAFRMTTSKEMASFLDELGAPETFAKLDEVVQATVKQMKKDFDLSKKIPPEKYQEFVVLTAHAESIWEDAKAKSDFSLFAPFLEKIVDYTKEFIEYWGYSANKYDTLLDQYEPGMTVQKLDQIFSKLRQKAVPLLQAITNASHKPDTRPLTREFNPKLQRDFGVFILQQMGYDFDAGRLDESVHPFETALNLGDVRITTKFNPNDFRTAIFGTIHEGGHALYEQNINPKFAGTPLCEGTSMGIHESQSRFWENIIGRSKSFWKCYYNKLQETFPESLKNIHLDDFYEAINHVEASLIRIEADELTYNLHIMIRYEIEKGLINDEIKVADLPRVWNEKMREYLGIAPGNNAEGVLQDVHWAGGSFGYFPSYSLGNIYAAQFEQAMRKDMPDMYKSIEAGNLLPINEWLNNKIHQYGKSLEPAEILLKVTGEEINPDYLTAYLEKKYNEIYRLK